MCTGVSVCILLTDALLHPAAELPPKRPSMVRHSISRAPPLSLEASDAASEMRDPGQKPGQQSEWWRNRRASTSAPRRSSMQRSASSRSLQPAQTEPRLQRSKTGLKLNQVRGHSLRCLLLPFTDAACSQAGANRSLSCSKLQPACRSPSLRSSPEMSLAQTPQSGRLRLMPSCKTAKSNLQAGAVPLQALAESAPAD